MASSFNSTARHVLLTGPPGVGKTTLVCKLCESLEAAGIKCQGFYTAERRERGQRTGFDIITLAGEKATLATVQSSDIPQGRQYTVGKYQVQLQSFENFALPTLRLQGENHHVVVIDEIGKMELFSQLFTRQVTQTLDTANTTVIATIPIAKGRPLPFVESIRQRKDAALFTISRDNRDVILDDIFGAVKNSIKLHGG